MKDKLWFLSLLVPCPEAHPPTLSPAPQKLPFSLWKRHQAVVCGVSIGVPSPGMEPGHIQAAAIALPCPIKPLAAQPDLAGSAWCGRGQLCRVSGAHLGKNLVPDGIGGSCPLHLPSSVSMAVLGCAVGWASFLQKTPQVGVAHLFWSGLGTETKLCLVFNSLDIVKW